MAVLSILLIQIHLSMKKAEVARGINRRLERY